MLKSAPFAHAVTIITVVFYIACVLLSYIAPDFLFNIAQSWIHSLNIQALKQGNPMSINSVIYGLVTIAVVTWITTYATIELYNRLAKKSK